MKNKLEKERVKQINWKEKGIIMFVCKECGAEVNKWTGKCPVCGAWNTLIEVKDIVSKKNKRLDILTREEKAQSISEIKKDKVERIKSEISELDITLGGRRVTGKEVLIGGEPGIGKSTLLLQLSNKLAERNKKVLYVSGEESKKQIKIRSDRLAINSQNLFLYCDNKVENILQEIEREEPDFIVIDSIQSVFVEALENIPGSVTQLRESTAIFTKIAKDKSIPIFLVGHITKEGIVAGPKIIEHMVDTVLYFERDLNNNFKILRSTKNRFGSTNEIGIFEMSNFGLKEIKNPSSLFLNSIENATGSSIACIMEGSRVFLVEVQALVTHSNYGVSQRVAIGFDHKRLSMLIAVLEKNIGLDLRQKDIFLNITGGIKVMEPSLDLAVIASVLSSVKESKITPKTAFIGEVGLSGEVRAVSQIEKRIKEAMKLGYEKIFVSHKANTNSKVKKIKTINGILPFLFEKK